jgi:hypothetical protein
MQRILLTAGLVLIAAALLWPWLSKLPLGRLPGDFRIEREGFSLYFPLATGLLLSAVVSLVLWWLRK